MPISAIVNPTLSSRGVIITSCAALIGIGIAAHNQRIKEGNEGMPYLALHRHIELRNISSNASNASNANKKSKIVLVV